MKQTKRTQALIATMRRMQRAGVVGCLLSISNAAMASLWFLPSGGVDSVDFWDAPERWYTWLDFETTAESFRQQTDMNLVHPGTILVTNDVYPSGYWYVCLAGRQNETPQPVVVRESLGSALTCCVSPDLMFPCPDLRSTGGWAIALDKEKGE